MTIDRVTIFRMKDSVSKFDDIVKTTDSKGFALPDFRKLNVPDLDDFDAEVTAAASFRQITTSKKDADDIPWLGFMNLYVDGDPFEFKGQNSFPAGTILLRIKRAGSDRFYALTFGLGGDALIDREQIEGDFGIRVAMNICKDGELKRVQTSIHELISTQSERQISAGGRVSAFSMDSEREFLQRLSGKARDEFSYVSSFSGRESLTVRFDKDDELDWPKLVSRVDDLSSAAESDDYKAIFEGYDRFVFVNDHDLIDDLDTQLFTLIAAKNSEKVHLAIPDFVDFDVLTFSYSDAPDADRHDDISLDDWIDSRAQKFRADSNIATIKRSKIFSWNSETGTAGKRWSVYRCIVAEVEKDNTVFVLSMGQWRKISNELRQQVVEYIATIEVVKLDFLPDGLSIWVPDGVKDDGSPKGTNEESAYNQQAFDASQATYLFDRAKIEIAGEKMYEVCDILHVNKIFVHAKRLRSGSASVGHVFVQARFYADAIFGDDRCRKTMREYMVANPKGRDVQPFVDIIPLERNEMLPHEFEVLFCILTEKQNLALAALPFMARYELMRTHKYLRDRVGVGGCKVCFPQIVLGP